MAKEYFKIFYIFGQFQSSKLDDLIRNVTSCWLPAYFFFLSILFNIYFSEKTVPIPVSDSQQPPWARELNEKKKSSFNQKDVKPEPVKPEPQIKPEPMKKEPVSPTTAKPVIYYQLVISVTKILHNLIILI